MARNKPSGAARAADLDPLLSHVFTVRRTLRETHDTFTAELVPPKEVSGFPFAPGQFNMLYAYGIGEVPISISGDPARPQTLVHTIRAVGSVTQGMQRLKTGDQLGVRGPYGSSWPVVEAEGSDVVIITGGIGLAPLRPAIYHLLANRGLYGRVILLYGARTPDEMLYRRELEKWRGRFDMETLVTVDSAPTSWYGNVGVVTQLIRRATFDPLHLKVFVCGPEIMMRFTILELQKRDVPDDRVYLSLERNMKCGIGLCGHCQVGSTFVCKDGPIYRYDQIKSIIGKREL